jgi:hypothetical protein
MGASESSLAATEAVANVSGNDSKYIFKLYSRKFETEEELHKPDDNAELYLHDYGEESESVQQELEAPIATPWAPVEDDDDYPIETMQTNLSNQSVAPESTEAIPQETEVEASSSIRATFESARVQRTGELESRYPAMNHRSSACENERAKLMQCYKDKEDILNCRTAVDAYAQCAKSALDNIN